MNDPSSAGDDDHRAPPERPTDIIGLLSETIGEDKRTKNLIRLVLVVAVPAVVAVAILGVVLVVAVKGDHVLENRGVWACTGYVGTPSLVGFVIWFSRWRKRRTVSGAAAVDEQPTPLSVEKSRSQTPQARTAKSARRPR